MQQTTKYQFKLIEGSDDFSPQPLNDNVEKVEDVLSGMESTMEDALEEMETAVGAAYSPDNQPYVAGTYVGTGTDTTITLGFRPKFLIVSGMGSLIAGNSTTAWDRYFGLCDGVVLSKRLAFTDAGFLARAQSADYDYFPNFTESGRTYSYIAFR